METKKISKGKTLKHHFQLVKGKFTPSQSSDVIMALIDQKISYHKLERIQNFESNHKFNQKPLSDRIKELEEEKKNVREFIAKVKNEEKFLKIEGFLTLTIEE